MVVHPIYFGSDPDWAILEWMIYALKIGYVFRTDAIKSCINIQVRQFICMLKL